MYVQDFSGKCRRTQQPAAQNVRFQLGEVLHTTRIHIYSKLGAKKEKCNALTAHKRTQPASRLHINMLPKRHATRVQEPG